MAEDGAFACEQDCGEVTAFAAQVRMADGIDASMDRVQPAGLDPPVDRISAESETEQLQSTDGAVLPGRNPGDRRIDVVRSTFAANSAVFVDLAGHAASIGAAVLQRCANCQK
jgi:hypothetical protein